MKKWIKRLGIAFLFSGFCASGVHAQTMLTTSSYNKPNGTAQLDASAQIATPVVGDVSNATVNGVALSELFEQNGSTNTNLYVLKTAIDQKNGVAGLDDNGNITAPSLDQTLSIPKIVGGTLSATDLSNGVVTLTGGTSDTLASILSTLNTNVSGAVSGVNSMGTSDYAGLGLHVTSGGVPVVVYKDSTGAVQTPGLVTSTYAQTNLVASENGTSTNQKLSAPVVTGGISTDTVTASGAITGDVSNATAEPTGGVSRTVAEKVADMPNVLDYGAKGDGVTDDGAAIVAAIAAANGHGAVNFPYKSGGYLINTGSFTGGESSLPIHYSFNGSYLSGTAVNNPGNCWGTLQSPAGQTCLMTTNEKFVFDPSNVYQTPGTTNVGMSVDCLPSKQNPNSAINGNNWACIFRSVDSGDNSDAASKSYGTELDNDEIYIGTAASTTVETDVEMYDTVLDGGVTRWEFALAGMSPYSNVIKNVYNGANVWGNGAGWALDIEDTPTVLPQTPYTVVSTAPTGTQAELSGSSGAWVLTFPTVLTKGYTVYVYQSGTLIQQTYISDWTTSTVNVTSTAALTTSNTTVTVGVVPSYTSPGSSSSSQQATYSCSNGSCTLHPRWTRGMFVTGAVDDVYLSERMLGESGSYIDTVAADGSVVMRLGKTGELRLNHTAASQGNIQFASSGSYTSSLGSTSNDAFTLADNTQSGAPWAIDLAGGNMTLGEGGSHVVTINNDLHMNGKVCLDTTCSRYIYESGSKVYIANSSGNLMSVDDSGNVVAKGSITGNSTP